MAGESVRDFLYPLHLMVRGSHIQPTCILLVDARCWHHALANLFEIRDPMESRHHHFGELPLTVAGRELAGKVPAEFYAIEMWRSLFVVPVCQLHAGKSRLCAVEWWWLAH